jgi:SAM-dependent methyltransferase
VSSVESKTLDAAAFREGQREQWSKAATGWVKWSEVVERGAGQVSKRLVELAGVEKGSRVLDVGAGYGEPSLTAARVAGPDGKVVATDISPGMLEFARKRTADAGVENIEFVESDAAGLDFPPGSFDAAASRWGIIFEPDGEGAAARIRGILEPGSRMAISSWGPPDTVPLLAVPMRTAMQRLNVEPPPPGTPGPLSRPTPEAIGGLLSGGGFSDIEVEEMQLTFEWPSAGEFVTFIREIAPPITAMIDPHPKEVQDETWAAITEAVRELAADDGTVRLTNLALLAAGKA